MHGVHSCQHGSQIPTLALSRSASTETTSRPSLCPHLHNDNHCTPRLRTTHSGDAERGQRVKLPDVLVRASRIREETTAEGFRALTRSVSMTNCCASGARERSSYATLSSKSKRRT